MENYPKKKTYKFFKGDQEKIDFLKEEFKGEKGAKTWTGIMRICLDEVYYSLKK